MYRPANDPKYQGHEPLGPNDVDPGVIVSADTLRADRLPPGQARTRKWPVLDAHGTPDVRIDRWRLRVIGLIEQPLQFTLQQFQQLPRVRVLADFHCVTRWSRLGNLWEGVSAQYLLGQAVVKPEAKFAILHGCDSGWTTSLPLGDFLGEDVVLADRHDGQPIPADHGGPVRAVVPRLYAWKSAKWLWQIELSAVNQAGYWERAGYHDRGDPWREQRMRAGG